MKAKITGIVPDITLDLPSVSFERMIFELEKLKDNNSICSKDFPVLWQISVTLKEMKKECQKIVNPA